LRMQVRGEGGVAVVVGVDGEIIVVVLQDHDPLGNGELLFQVMGDGLFILPSEGGGALACLCLIQDLVCGRHDSDESLLPSVRCSGGGLSCCRGIVLLPLGGGGGSDLLPINGGEVGVVARHGQQDGGG
jgi:hypothetical protein